MLLVQMQQEGGGSMLATCPSFSCEDSNSINNFARTAIRVSQELHSTKRDFGLEDTEDSDFEFACIHTAHEAFAIPAAADDIFSDGKIRPIFPIEMNRDFGGDDDHDEKLNLLGGSSNPLPRHTLMTLMNEERDSESTMEEKCTKKSSSTGTSKRWSLRDLIHRSNSDGRENVDVLARSSSCSKLKSTIKREEKKTEEVPKDKRNRRVRIAGNMKSHKKSAHEIHYTRNRALKEAERRRSFLPYKQDLVGFFASVNGLSKHLHPF